MSKLKFKLNINMVNLCLSFLIFGLLETSSKRNMLVYDGLSKNNISHFEGFVDQKMVIKMCGEFAVHMR